MDSKTLALIVKGIDEASATLRDIKGEVKGLGSEAATTSQDLQPLGRSLSAVGAAGAALISITALTAARVEVLGTVLYTVGETAGYTEGQLDTLEEGVAGLGITTGAARQGLVQMMQAELDLAEATDIASIAQDSAVIANVNSSAAYETLVRGILTGRSVLLKSLGLTVDFNAAYKRMAEELGKSTLELTANEKMQARLNEVKRAGAIIEGTYEAAMGDVGKKLTSMPRLLEEAGVALGQSYLPGMEGAVDATSDMLKAFIDLEPEQQAAIANFIAITTATTGFGGGLILLLPKIAAAKAAMTALNLTMLGPVGLVAAGLAAVYAITQLPVPLENATNSLATLEEASKALEPELYAAAEAEQAVRDEAKRLREETHDLADGWMSNYSPALIEAREQTTGWEVALLGVNQPIVDVMGSTEDLTEAVWDYTIELDLLKNAVAGPVAKANEDYIEQQQKLNEKIAEGEVELAGLQSRHGLVYGSQTDLTHAQEGAELATRKLAEAQAKLAENTDPEKQLRLETAVWRAEGAITRQDEAVRKASGGITDYGEDIWGVEQDLAGWRGELLELEAQHKDTISKIIYDMVMAQLALDGWTAAEIKLGLDTARSMHIVDEETYAAGMGIIDTFTLAREQGTLPFISDIIRIRDDVLDLGTAANEVGVAIPIGLRQAESGFNDIDAWAKDAKYWIDQIPRNVPIHTEYTSSGTPPQHYPEGYQHGTDYVPRTGYAYLHEGEAVLTKEENRRGGGRSGGITIHNHFGKDSVRSDKDIQSIADDQQRMYELQGLRVRIA